MINTSRTSLLRNSERYLGFYPAVTQAFLEVSDLRPQFFFSPLVPCTRSVALHMRALAYAPARARRINSIYCSLENKPRNRLGPTAARVDSQDYEGQLTLRITDRSAAGSQDHEFSIKSSIIRPVSVLFRRSTYSREGINVNLGQILKI